MSVKYETMNYKVYGGRRGPERFRGIRPTSVLAILGLVTATAQCSIQARPADNSDPTSTFPRPRETFTPVPTPVHIEGSSWQTDEILAFGRALGGGGVGRTDATYANDFLVRKLYEDDGLRVLVDGVRTNQGEPLLTQVQVLPDGTRICLPNSPVRIFDPDLPPEEGHERLFDANFIRYYGFREPQEITFQTVPAVSLDALADNLICVNTIAAAGRINVFGVREGTVMTVLLDKETGEIYGGFRSVFGAGDILGFDQTTGKLTVNGQSVWFEGPGMLQLTPTPTSPLSTEIAEHEAPPLYSECGPVFERIYATSGNSPVGADGLALPTGLQPNSRDRIYLESGGVSARARGCLVRAETSGNFFDANEGTLTMAFWDVNGVKHLIPFTVGGERESYPNLVRIGVTRGGGFHYTISVDELIEALNKLLDSETRSKQIDFSYAVYFSASPTRLPSGTIVYHDRLSELVNRYPGVNEQLFEALRTGEGFPEIPEDYFLLLGQIITPLPFLPEVGSPETP